ncbi:MAG TPA: methylmalonyl Co-A mutase-associated GTPase MeaB [Acidimicrobiales bacterium]|jgi:LAO/AO transport system kinase
MELVDAASAGDRTAIARLISLIERGGDPAREVARLTYAAPDAYTVGLTGAPGAGKSTLSDGLIAEVRKTGQPLGVLAIDPSSPFTGGAILGDRVRMQGHALDEGVFIRSMATRGHLGGLALATPEAVRVLAAAGLPIVLIETVGVGQVEVEVARAADCTVVVVNPGWGDSIQANKAGLLEIADIFVINKADRPGATETRRDLDNMLDMTSTMGEWRPPIVQTVAATGDGVEQLWAVIGDHRAYLERSGELVRRRHRRVLDEFSEVLVRRVESRVRQLEDGRAYERAKDAVLAREVDPYGAADELLGMLGL